MGAQPSLLADFYDVVIDIHSFQEGKRGWPIFVSRELSKTVESLLLHMLDGHSSLTEDESFDFINELQNTLGLKNSRQVVATLGPRKSGKTFVLSKLTNVNRPVTDVDVSAKGINLLLPSTMFAKDFVWMDSVGVTGGNGELTDKKTTEAILRDIVLESASIVIVVVNELRWSDQEMIDDVYQRMCGLNPNSTLLVVHNFKDVADESMLLYMWKKYVLKPHPGKVHYVDVNVTVEGEKPSIKRKSARYFVCERTNIHHFCLAREGTPAGKATNDTTFALLKRFISPTKSSGSSSFIESFLHILTGAVQKTVMPSSGNHATSVKVELRFDVDYLTRLSHPDYVEMPPPPPLAMRPGPGAWYTLSDARDTVREIARAACPVRLFVDEEVFLARSVLVSYGPQLILGVNDHGFSPAVDLVEDETGLVVVVDVSGFDTFEGATDEIECHIDKDDAIVLKGKRFLTYRPYTCDEDGVFNPGDLRAYKATEYWERISLATKKAPSESKRPPGGGEDNLELSHQTVVERSERKRGVFSRSIKFDTRLYDPEIVSFDILDGVAQLFLRRRRRSGVVSLLDAGSALSTSL